MIEEELSLLNDLGLILDEPYELINHDGEIKYYINLPYLGEPLAEKNSVLDRDQQYAISIELFFLLHQLHTGKASRRGVKYTHRDIRPDNIVRNHLGKLFLIDYGFAEANPENVGVRMRGTRVYNSPIFFEDSGIMVDMVAAMRTAFFEKNTIFFDDRADNFGRAFTDAMPMPLPWCIFKNLDQSLDKTTIQLLSAYDLCKTGGGRLLNRCSDFETETLLPTSMLELAAKLALLRKDPDSDLGFVNEKNQYAIVALSLANISHHHSIWDIVLSRDPVNTIQHDELLNSITRLFEFGQALVNDESMNGDLSEGYISSIIGVTNKTVFNTNSIFSNSAREPHVKIA